MNYDRMLELADALENETLPVAFNMNYFSAFYTSSGWRNHSQQIGDTIDCGTVCCIAGLASLRFGNRGEWVGRVTARRVLDLSGSQCKRLFYNYNSYISPTGDLSDITRAEAVAAIRRMVAEDKLEHGAAAVEAEELVYA